MSKGHNHSPNCQCNFCMNRRIKSAPKTRGEYESQRLNVLRRKARLCNYCGKPIFFQKFPNLGIGAFDIFGTKHKCQLKPDEYKVFKKIGVPSLRKILSTYEKNGWIPLFEVESGTDLWGPYLKGKAIDEPYLWHFQTEKRINVSDSEIIYFRPVDDFYEVNLFDNDERDFIIIVVRKFNS